MSTLMESNSTLIPTLVFFFKFNLLLPKLLWFKKTVNNLLDFTETTLMADQF